MTTEDRDESEKSHAVCPLCDRIVTRDTEEELVEIIENHNELRHEGENIALLVGPNKEDLNDFVDKVRKRHGPVTGAEIGMRMVEKGLYDIGKDDI